MKPAPHTRVRRPRQPDAVQWDNTPEHPSPVAEQGHEHYAGICPVGDIPHVLGQALCLEVLAGALDAAIGGGDGARLTLEEEVDEDLRGREDEVEDQRLAGERGAEEERAVEPEEQVDDEGDEGGLVEAARVCCGERLDCFLERVLAIVNYGKQLGESSPAP